MLVLLLPLHLVCTVIKQYNVYLILNSNNCILFNLGMSNKENNHTIRLAISALKNNIPCNRVDCNHAWYYEDLPDNTGFRRITPCSNINLWNPIAMIDKHRPTKLGVDGLLSGTILCWFHIMQNFGENLKNWNINQSLRYIINLFNN